MQNDLIWSPTPEVVEQARVTAFMREHGIDDWHELHRRATDDIGGPMWTRWFCGGTVNLTHNCVGRHARDTPERLALVCEREDGEVSSVSYDELEARVNRIANALLELGVGQGDAVGLFLPMSVEVVAGFYAICKIGAIVVPIFSGFGATAVAARLEDAGAVALLTADAVPRR